MSDRELESLRRQSEALEKRILELKSKLAAIAPRSPARFDNSSRSDKRHTGGIRLLNRACEFVAEGAPDGAYYVFPSLMFLALPFVFFGSMAISVLLMGYVFVFLPIRAIARFVSRQLFYDPSP
jgi:hypothetical protein